MNEEDAAYAIKMLMIYYNVDNLKKLAKKINVSPAFLSNWKQRNSVGPLLKQLIKVDKKALSFIANSTILSENDTFMQTGDNSQQIKTQNNDGEGMHINSTPNKSNNNSNKIDPELLPLFEALNGVAAAFNKKEMLKKEIAKLISQISSQQEE